MLNFWYRSLVIVLSIKNGEEHMKRLLTACGIALAGLSLTACGGGGDSKVATGEDAAKNVDVVSWWQAGSEAKGLEALQEVFKKQHPETEFANKAISGGAGSQAKQKLQSDLAAKNPPDSYQAHAGAEIADDIDAGYLEDVSKLYDEFKLRDAFPKTLIDRLTVDGKIYSVPSNIHRANVVWANVEVLKAAGLDPEKPAADLDSWIEDMKKVKAAGKTPITIGMAWTQTQLLETILIADLGAEGYNGLFDGTTKWDGPEVKKALDHFKQITDLADNKGLLQEDWEPAMKPIIDGTAAYNVMGDWAPAAFDAAKKEWGKDYVTFAVPGTADVFDFLADSFTLPVGAKHPAGTKNWLHTISSKEGQVAFNTIKGSIPARSDLSDEDIKKFSPYQQSAMKDFKDKTIVSSIAHGAAVPAKVSNAINDACSKFLQSGSSVEDFQKDLVKATESLAKKK